MIVGVLKEIKNNENRVGLTPAGAYALVKAGHKVLVEETAGVGSGFADSEYTAAGAQIVKDKKAIADQAAMIIKVKEPLPSEYDLFHDGQVWFTYFHLAPEPELTAALMKKNVVAVAYETVQLPDRSLPLLQPMSEVAGRMSIQVGANYLQKFNGGEGILIGGVAGVPAGEVVIVGGGIVGTNAAKMAIGLGAHVTILDNNLNRLRYLDDIFGARISTLASNPFNLAEAAKKADILVGSVLIPGARAPKLITEEMVKSMKPGSVIVDVAIDQGGSVATVDHATTHADPVFVKHGVVHYSVANMPGAVARTSTFALTNATLPYTLALANKGWKKAIADDKALALGVNVVNGKVTFKGVADGLNLPYTPLEEAVR